MNSSIEASIDIENTGSMSGKEVVQFYLKDEYASVMRPDKELKYFEKVELDPGEKKTVSFMIQPAMLQFKNGGRT